MNQSSELADWQDHLEAALPEPTLVRVYQQTDSTQDIAKSFAPNQTLILADQQTAGRGRLGRAWVSEPGKAVLMSLCWPMVQRSSTHDRVSMLAGVAVARTVERLLPNTAVRIKWPNDVMIEQRKVAGILIEAVHGAFIIGIGLNVGLSSHVYTATEKRSASLCEFGTVPDRLIILERLVTDLQLRLRADSHGLSTWRRLAALGQTQTFEHSGQRITGEVLDLDPDHGLIVRRDTGEIITLPAATTSVVK